MNDKKTIYYIGGAVLAYFIILKPVLQKFGIVKTKEEIEREKQKDVFLQTTNEVPTKTPGEWTIVADQIYEDLRYSALDDNKDDAAYQVTRVKNNTDFKLLYKAFGNRQEYSFFVPVGSKKDLQQFIKSNLSNNQILKINDNYRRKKISFQF